MHSSNITYAFDHNTYCLTRAWFNYTDWKKQWKWKKNKERVCTFLNMVTKNAYKETANIVSILSRDEILERDKFTVPFYSITLVLEKVSPPHESIWVTSLVVFYFRFINYWKIGQKWSRMTALVKIMPVEPFLSVNRRFFSPRLAYVTILMQGSEFLAILTRFLNVRTSVKKLEFCHMKTSRSSTYNLRPKLSNLPIWAEEGPWLNIERQNVETSIHRNDETSKRQNNEWDKI